MKAEERRAQVLKQLNEDTEPVSATKLAQRNKVSRQIVVGDIALLRAQGHNILATPRGYILERPTGGITHTVACLHSGSEMEEEMNIMVDMGCTIVNVIVEHPVYGQIIGPLNCKSRRDVQLFIQKAKDSTPLSDLTSGVHLHTLLCENEDCYTCVLRELKAHGFLFEG